MKLLDEVPVDTAEHQSDFTFDSRSDFEDDLDDFLSSFFCLTRSFLSLHSLDCTLDGWKCLAVPEIE